MDSPPKLSTHVHLLATFLNLKKLLSLASNDTLNPIRQFEQMEII
jgi:hypothetical protein